MHMPTPNEHHDKLARIAGSWKGQEVMHPSEWVPEGSTCEATTTSRIDLGGFAVVSDYQQAQDGKTTYAGHGVYTIDHSNQDVLLHWFDSMGSPPELFRGRWEGDVLTLQSSNANDHHMRFVQDYSEEGKLKTQSFMSEDGENWKTMFDGNYARQ